MSSYAVRLPLALDSSTGYGMITRIKELVKQNMKMLILTNPGERVMDPNMALELGDFFFKTLNQMCLRE